MTSRLDVAESTTSTFTYDAHTEASCSEGQSGGWGRGRIGAVAQVTGSSTVYTEAYCYDSVGRLSAKSVSIPGEGTFGFQWAYNAGTGDLETITYPAAAGGARPRIKYEFSNGHLYRVRDDLNSLRILRSNNYRNARGQVTYWEETEHTNPDCASSGYCGAETNDFDAVTGLLMHRDSLGVATGWTGDIQKLDFTWDRVGNMLSRQDRLRTSGGQYLKETFECDALYRLDKVKDAFGTMRVDIDYLANGNISKKTDVGGDQLYEYADLLHVHAATRAGSNTYAYDANGNANSEIPMRSPGTRSTCRPESTTRMAATASSGMDRIGSATGR